MELPDGWIEHDGGPCPVALDGKPGVMFKDGHIMPAGQYRVDYWLDVRWTGKRGPNMTGKLPPRIIAYKPEPHP